MNQEQHKKHDKKHDKKHGIPPRRKSTLRLTSSMSSPSPSVIQSFRKSDKDLANIPNRAVREFYVDQNEVLDSFAVVDRIIDNIDSTVPTPVRASEPSDIESAPLLSPPPSDATGSSSPSSIQAAINISFLVNIILFISKAFISMTSGSLSLLASTFDSLLDLLCGAIIWYAARMSSIQNLQKYPVGKSRMEPLGVVVFAAVTATSFTQVLVSSLQRLLAPASDSDTVELDTVELTILGVNVVVKIVLWIWCRSIKGSSSIRALAQDHGNDVVFNIAGAAFPIIGAKLDLWWLDALGGILLSVWIIWAWIGTLLENIRRLTGQSASPLTLKTLTYLAYRFSPAISALETVRAYHVGDKLFVEVDVVLPENMPLREAHDVGEALQGAIESMEDVERAFVHLDWEWRGAREHVGTM